MKKIQAKLLTLFTFRTCSVPGCDNRASAQTGYFQYLCQLHLERIALGKLAIEKEQERRRKQRVDFLEQVESDKVLRDIEHLGLENYDPETDKPKDAGKYMHQARTKPRKE